LRAYSSVESTTGTDEETSTNGTTNGNHMHVAGFHSARQLDIVGRPTLEGLEVETIPGQKVLILVALNLAILNVGRRRRRASLDIGRAFLGLLSAHCVASRSKSLSKEREKEG
jgi:hypothetical protein